MPPLLCSGLARASAGTQDRRNAAAHAQLNPTQPHPAARQMEQTPAGDLLVVARQLWDDATSIGQGPPPWRSSLASDP
jgi:hypothetical protein